MHRDDLTWPEALALAAVDRDQLLERLHDTTGTGVIAPPPSLWPTTPPPARVRWLRWRWQCTDPATGAEIEFGHAPTQRRAIKRRDKARNRIHDERRDAAAKRIHDERLEADR